MTKQMPVDFDVIEDKKIKKMVEEIHQELIELGLRHVPRKFRSSYKLGNRNVVRLFPLKKGFSALVGKDSKRKWKKDELVKEAKKVVEDINQSTKQDKKQKSFNRENLEKRVSQLSKNSKGLNIKQVRRAPEFEAWVKENGYRVDGDTLIVK